MYEIVKIADIYTKYLKVPTRIITQKIKRAEFMKVLILTFPSNRGFLFNNLSLLFENEKFTMRCNTSFLIVQILLNEKN